MEKVLLEVDIRLERALLAVDKSEAERILVQAAAEASGLSVFEELVTPALERIGKAWEDGRVALSQLYMSGRICEELLDTLLPQTQADAPEGPKIAVTTLGDHHTLGKRLVCASVRSGGFQVLDYGAGLGPEEVVDRILRDNIEVLMISVLILPSALRISKVFEGLRRNESDCKIIVGGAPFIMDPGVWREVGADAMGRTASEAPALIRQVLSKEFP